jgi:hypothetical protein
MRSRIASCTLLLAFLALGAPAWADNATTGDPIATDIVTGRRVKPRP